MPERYWRFVPSIRNCQLAELVFRDAEGRVLTGRPIGPDVVRGEKLFDNDPLTYTYIDQWVGAQISEFRRLFQKSFICPGTMRMEFSPEIDTNYSLTGFPKVGFLPVNRLQAIIRWSFIVCRPERYIGCGIKLPESRKGYLPGKRGKPDFGEFENCFFCNHSYWLLNCL